MSAPGLLFDAARAQERLGVVGVPPGAVVQLLDGRIVRLGEDGIADVVLPPGHPRPGLASDESARSRRRRP